MKIRADISPPEEADLPQDLLEVMDYWNDLRGDRTIPSLENFKLLELNPRVLPDTILMDVISEPLDFIYRFWGTGNTKTIGIDCTGKSVRENHLFGEKVFQEYKQVADTKKPIAIHSLIEKPDGRRSEYWRIRVPFAGKDGSVVCILSVQHVFRMSDFPTPFSEWFD